MISLRAGVAGLMLLPLMAASVATAADPQHTPPASTQRPPSGAARPMPGFRRYGIAPGCTSDDLAPSERFVGITDGDYADFASQSGSAVAGGMDNEACDVDAGIGAGMDNVIGGGSKNTANSFVGGGENNEIVANDSFAGGGIANRIGSDEAFIGGGDENQIGSAATYGSVGGGYRNDVDGSYAAIGGGGSNLAQGAFSMIPGGADNIALGSASFAAGYHAKAGHNGSFVWSDDVSGSGYATDGNTNEFIVRASGGTYVFSNEAESVGVKLASGSGAWASTSDRNAKTDMMPLDDASVLAKVAALPIATWRYKTEAGVRHVGPMAQDFYAAFRVGEDDRHITSIDEDGVALAAIKALVRENGRLRTRLAAVETRDGDVAALRSELHRLEARLEGHGGRQEHVR